MYWSHILNEVENKPADGLGYRYIWHKPAPKPKKLVIRPGYTINMKDQAIYCSARELDVAFGLFLSLTLQQIADDLGLSRRTVEVYCQQLYKKFGCNKKKAFLIKACQGLYEQFQQAFKALPDCYPIKRREPDEVCANHQINRNSRHDHSSLDTKTRNNDGRH